MDTEKPTELFSHMIQTQKMFLLSEEPYGKSVFETCSCRYFTDELYHSLKFFYLHILLVC